MINQSAWLPNIGSLIFFVWLTGDRPCRTNFAGWFCKNWVFLETINIIANVTVNIADITHSDNSPNFPVTSPNPYYPT
jgi:hypothetical protein